MNASCHANMKVRLVIQRMSKLFHGTQALVSRCDREAKLRVNNSLGVQKRRGI